MTEAARGIPILIVTGFLGSGKTTLIRHLLTEPRLGEVAIIVNEFGEVGIDHHLVRKTDERTTLLKNGCVCCSLRDDLKEALRDLLGRRERGEIPRFARVVIETTGVADPVPILQTIVADPVVRNHYRVERVVTTIDAVAGRTNLATYGEAVKQIATADLLIVTKADLAGATAVAALASELRALSPAALIHEAVFGVVPWDLLAAPSRGPVPEPADETGIVHTTSGRIVSRCLVFERALNWPMFGIWLTLLLHRHGDRILRMKGLLDVGADKGPLLLEGVQHVIHAPRHLAAWPDDDRRGRVVFITRDLDPGLIEESLLTFQDVAGAV